MRAIVQRVTSAKVTAGGEVIGRIGGGLCVLVGVTHSDAEPEAERLAAKLWGLRVFADDEGVMNRSLSDSGAGEVLIVSQFTLYGDTTRGRRPSWVAAARPEQAEPLISAVAERLSELGAQVQTGSFGADMLVELVNDGPVTLVVDV